MIYSPAYEEYLCRSGQNIVAETDQELRSCQWKKVISISAQGNVSYEQFYNPDQKEQSLGGQYQPPYTYDHRLILLPQKPRAFQENRWQFHPTIQSPLYHQAGIFTIDGQEDPQYHFTLVRFLPSQSFDQTFGALTDFEIKSSGFDPNQLLFIVFAHVNPHDHN